MTVTGPSVDVAARRSPGRPRDQRADQAIAAATLRQLDEVGYVKLSMESIANEAGVARATVYRRYADKADLVTAVIAADVGGQFPCRPSRDPRADLIHYLEEFDARFGESCLEVIGTLLASREDRDALDLHRRRIVAPRTAFARGLLEQAQAMGLLDASLDAELAIEMLAGAVFARRVHGTASSKGWARSAVDMLWRNPESRGGHVKEGAREQRELRT
jgi:AcrR family transcriptional regulator